MFNSRNFHIYTAYAISVSCMLHFIINCNFILVDLFTFCLNCCQNCGVATAQCVTAAGGCNLLLLVIIWLFMLMGEAFKHVLGHLKHTSLPPDFGHCCQSPDCFIMTNFPQI